jgi:hypothetical protein
MSPHPGIAMAQPMLAPPTEDAARRAALEDQWRNVVAEITRLSIQLWDRYAEDPTISADAHGPRFHALHDTSQLLTAARQRLLATEAALAETGYRIPDSSIGAAQHLGMANQPQTEMPSVAADRDQMLRRRRPARAPEASSVPPPLDIVDEWGQQSFPASDPPANW